MPVHQQSTWSRGAKISLLMAIALSVSACTENRSPIAVGTGSAPAHNVASSCVTTDLLACARLSSIGHLVPNKPIAATGNPITIGMINQENTPVGSFPELSQAVQANVEFINGQLGGIDGRPLKVDVCNTNFSPEGSEACAQKFVQAKVPAVLGGIDVFGNGIKTLRTNGIPFAGGITVSDASAKASNSFQWSGGIWGATVAFADYSAKTLHAKSAAIVYGEFGPITEGALMGKLALERNGVKTVQLVPHPVVAADLTSPVQIAAAGKPDVIFMLEADTGCKGAFDAIHNAGVKSKVFYVGACATPAIVNQAGPEKTNGAIFNVEGPINQNQPNTDAALYQAVIVKYGKGLDPIGAGTVSFRSFMNLYVIMRSLGANLVSAETITKALKSQVNAPSFMGHAYTCDGRQFTGLPAMCSPQQILVRLENGKLTQVGGWIDVGKV